MAGSLLAACLSLCPALAQAAEPAAPAAAAAPAATPAQAPPAPQGTLDDIPDAVPFAIPYGAPIPLAKAQAIVQSAIAEAGKRGWALSISVVDSAAVPIAFARMDGANIASAQIATEKALTAAKFRRPTKVFEAGIQVKGYNYLLSIPGAVASRGGLPILQDGKVVGAVGCSGGTGSQDEAVCAAALAANP